MGGERTIQDVVRILAGNDRTERVYAIDAKVLSVDESTRTAKVQAIGGRASNEFTARLMPVVEDGVFIIPTVDSIVCVILGDFTVPYVTQYSGVDKIVFRGGDLGGLVKVIDLTTKLNNLENMLNDLKTKFNTHVHPGVQAGGSSTSPTTTQETTTLVKTKREDIENKKVTHG